MAGLTKKIGFYRPHKRVQQFNVRIDPKTGELVELPSRTKQSFVAECDINNILKQYQKTGMLRHMNAKASEGAYRDLPDEMDYQLSMNVIKDAETAFASLPSKVRNRFENDPSRFLAFMSDEKNQEEWYELGLAIRPPPSPKGDQVGDQAVDRTLPKGTVIDGPAEPSKGGAGGTPPAPSS